MKPIYLVEYRQLTNPSEIVKKTVTIEAQGSGKYWLLDIETEKSFLINKDRVVSIRKHGTLDNLAKA